MRKFVFLATVFTFFALASLASAQQGDAMLGFGTVVSPGAAACGASFSTIFTVPKTEACIPISAPTSFSTSVWDSVSMPLGEPVRAPTAGLGGQPYRPILFDFNGVYQPRLSKKVGGDLMAGIGWQSTRFYGYQPTSSCVYFGACYQSSNHFLVDMGAGLRYYVWGHVFVRPEAHYYRIFNNTNDYSSDNVIRIGASIGYTIGGPD